MSYSDKEALEFSEELERIYKEDLNRDTRSTYIDPLGAARWFGDYRFLTSNAGLSHAQAMQGIRNEIYRIEGIPIPVIAGLQGRLVRTPEGWRDDSGHVLVRVIHFGDGLSLNIRNPSLCDNYLDAFADAGYHAVRTWTILRGDYWRNRECGPNFQSDFKAEIIEFAHKLSVRGLRWMVSQGDLLAEYSAQSDRKRVLRDIIEAINSVDPNLIIAIDMGNETWQNGESSRARLVELAEFVQTLTNCDTITLTSPQGEEKHELDLYTFRDVYDVHGSRAGRYWDKVRHIFSIPYEVKPNARLGIQSEGPGPGERVSVTSNKDELDSDVCALLAAQASLSRQMWVYMSGPGVVSDERERFWDMPGFYFVPDVLTKLPQDLMGFQRLVHGGKSQADRIYAVPAEDATRADHAIHDDGRFVCTIYGPQWRRVKSVRPHAIIEEIPLGDRGKIVIGKLS